MSDGAHAGTVEIDGPRRTLILSSLTAATMMQTLDNTIANVALPRMQGSFSATQDQMAWVLTTYIVAAAIMIPLSGWLAGRIGRRRVFLFSVAGFTIASMLCGLSQSLPQIVLARLLQGVSGAALVPLSQAALLDITPPARQPRAMSLWAMATSLGPIMGPALGGWLTENYNWRWVFFINVPIGILAFLGMASSLPATPTHNSRFDFFGFTSLSVGLAALQLLLDRGQINDWFGSTEIWIEAAVALAAFHFFAVHMLTTTGQRFINPALFKDRNFVAGCAVFFSVGLVMFATLALLPTMLENLMNYPVWTTGLVTAPRGIGSVVALLMIPRLMSNFDPRLIVGAGFVLTAVSAWQMTGFDLQMGTSTIVWSGLAQGVGVSFVFLPVASLAFATLQPALRNEGTSVFSLMRNLGSSIGISIVVTLVTRNTQIAHASLAGHVSYYNPAMHAITGASPTVRTLTELNATVTQQAAMIAYNDDFQMMLILSVAAIPLVLLFRKGAQKATEPVVVEAVD
jgi:MFS transporter, DHA2 family, multidrug resistance protein